MVDAYMKILLRSDFDQGHTVFNIGSGEATSVRGIAERLKEILGSDIEPVWGAMPHRSNELWFVCADITKAKQFLGWEPQVRILEKGLPLTVQYYQNFGGEKILSA